MPKSLGKQSSVFLWRDVGYDIKADKKEETRILEGIDGWVVRGTLTALLGSTGAGKTTLLDVLANRKYTGTVHGEVRIDGRARDGCFQRKTGYVQQADIHCPSATVREALEFSALLRQPRDLARSEKLAYVDTVLQMLEMEPYADAIVGVPGKGLNIEQRKRLTIAVEMAARPELLFLDEPTSGLDSQTAWSICTLLRKLSDNGQPILCTIHQPCSELFEMFDRLLFLQSGKTVYFGDLGRSASTVIDYFTRSGARIPALGENPAEWLLEVTATSPPKGTEDWRTVWETSQEAETSKTEIAAMERNACSTSAVVTEDYEYAASALTQLWVVTYRMFQDYWREPNYLYSKLALCIGSVCFLHIRSFSVTFELTFFRHSSTAFLFGCWTIPSKALPAPSSHVSSSASSSTPSTNRSSLVSSITGRSLKPGNDNQKPTVGPFSLQQT
jgi:ABC-type multidrug transport system ATPase subunit